MNTTESKAAVIAKHGPWTAHNIHLGDGVYTFSDSPGDTTAPRKMLQIAADFAKKPIDQLRVLDLGALEGLYAIEFALHGAQAVAIEGREANIAKARFAKEALGLHNLTLAQDNVLNLSVEKYGQFDLVLCIGILYHIDAPEVFSFLESISAVCTNLTIFHTHLGRHALTTDYKGKTYHGENYIEPSERNGSLWASLDNSKSFWPTRASLYNFLQEIGYTTISDCHVPYQDPKTIGGPDRVCLAAVKGERQQVRSVSNVRNDRNAAVPEGWRWQEKYLPGLLQRAWS